MPCYDPDTHERPIRLEGKVNFLTAQLCYLCEILDKASPNVISNNPDLNEWWKNHKNHDAKIAALKLKRFEHGDKSLTPEERGAILFANDPSY